VRGLFVTGTGTDVGKTVLAAALLAAGGEHLVYWKPIQTGAGPGEATGDTATVARLAELPSPRILDQGIRLRLPASPHHAAAQEGAVIDLAALARLGQEADRPGRRFVVEGAGGLLVPIDAGTLMTDLIRMLGLPLLVASGTRLGTINHTLLTAREIVRQELPALGIVLIGPADRSAESGLLAHSPLPVLARLPWLDPLRPPELRREGAALQRVPAIARALSPGDGS
jgi:dethiobiotin synthetase